VEWFPEGSRRFSGRRKGRADVARVQAGEQQTQGVARMISSCAVGQDVLGSDGNKPGEGQRSGHAAPVCPANVWTLSGGYRGATEWSAAGERLTGLF
jgi:hypothetical protein